jgi:hypothetical protein
MIQNDKCFTVVFRNLLLEDRVNLLDQYSDKLSASSYSHALHDRDGLISALLYAEAALADIGDADREEGDDLAWCENRAASALPRIRRLLSIHGVLPKLCTLNPDLL